MIVGGVAAYGMEPLEAVMVSGACVTTKSPATLV